VTSDIHVSTTDLSAGPIDYIVTGGAGPTMVLLHGVLMIALLVAELLERLDLDEVTLIMNDWGGPQLLVDHGRTERISRLVLVAGEVFDNFPPGAPGRRLAKLAATPGGFGLQSLLMRSPAVRRSVASMLAKHPVPGDLLHDWFEPFIRDRQVRQDLRRYCLSVPLDSGRNWSAGLASFDRPALVVWAPDDQMMPAAHGRMLADLLPDGRLVEIADSYTVVARPAAEARECRTRIHHQYGRAPAMSSARGCGKTRWARVSSGCVDDLVVPDPGVFEQMLFFGGDHGLLPPFAGEGSDGLHIFPNGDVDEFS